MRMGRCGNPPRLAHILCGLPLLVDLASGLRVGLLANATAKSTSPTLSSRPFDDRNASFVFKTYWDCTPPQVQIPQIAPQDDPEGKLKFVHVVYSADERELPGVLTSLTSLSRNLKKPEECIVHLIVAKAAMPQAKGLLECFKRTSSGPGSLPLVVLHSMVKPKIRLKHLMSVQSFRQDLIMPNTFVRFYLPLYLPKAHRAIWLDADTIVRADVAELYRMRLRNESVAAALPEAGWTRRITSTEAQTKGVYPFRDEEFNTGVVLFDLDKWRLDNYTEEAEYWTHHFKALGGDQVGLNMALLNKVDKIPDWRWNARGFQFGRPPWRCLEGAKIVHWSGSRKRVKKPWQIGEDPEARYRWRYDMIEPYVLDPPCLMNATL